MAEEDQSSSNMVPSSVIRTASASITARPMSGVFGINKPSGPTSMSLLDDLKPLFASSALFASENGDAAKEAEDKRNRKGKWGKGKGRPKWRGGVVGAPKLGQGGTLDPLADGVLVIGVGNGTKHLQKYLDCTKEYRTTALLGSATTSYDSCDPILRRAPYSHVTRTSLQNSLPKFTGSLLQTPPLYSAVRIDGKRLFEYARENIPLPRPIEARKVRVDELRIVDWLEGGKHSFKEPDREVPDEEKSLVGRVLQLTGRKEGQTDTRKEDEQGTEDAAEVPAEQQESVQPLANSSTEEQGLPPAFTLEMTVSSGTYVRSIVHDLAIAVKSAAHVQKLTRLRQGEWSIDTTKACDPDAEHPQSQEQAVIKGNCIPWKIFADGIQEMNRETQEPEFKAERDEQGFRSWERELLQAIVPV